MGGYGGGGCPGGGWVWGVGVVGAQAWVGKGLQG